MGQAEVYKTLEESDKPLSLFEISTIMEETTQKISSTLARLLKGGDIYCIELDRIQAMKRTEGRGRRKVKQRMRLFFINKE